MTKYCKNCEKQLEKHESLCKKCNETIINKQNYKNNIFKNIKKPSYIYILIVIISTIIFIIRFTDVILVKYKYVNNYIEKNNYSSNYKISFEKTGRCIENTYCSFYLDGCIATKNNYVYGCKAYYFKVRYENHRINYITVIKKNNNYYTITGKYLKGVLK